MPFVRTYSEPKDTSYAGLVRVAFHEAAPGFVPLTGPVSLTVQVTQKMPGPAEWKRKQKIGGWSTTKPDLSNVLKLIEDALNGLAYVDDRQIAQATVRKWIGDQGEAPCVEVFISSLEKEAPK